MCSNRKWKYIKSVFTSRQNNYLQDQKLMSKKQSTWRKFLCRRVEGTVNQNKRNFSEKDSNKKSREVLNTQGPCCMMTLEMKKYKIKKGNMYAGRLSLLKSKNEQIHPKVRGPIQIRKLNRGPYKPNLLGLKVRGSEQKVLSDLCSFYSDFRTCI